MPASTPLLRRLGRTELEVHPICLGTNVFGWTIDQAQSFAVLDRYLSQGGNLLDTSDSYSAFAPGNRGGESETIIGHWLQARGRRDDVLIATKVGRAPGRLGLAPATIHAAVEESLARLRTDYIDLYYAHADDPQTPLEQTLSAFDELVRAGKVRHIAASNYSAERLAEALEVSQSLGLVRYEALQPHYNLVVRDEYEGPLAQLCVEQELSCLPYWALAKGFLTGKYRPGAQPGSSPRAGQASAYLDERGARLLEILDQVAAAHAVAPVTVALAWLLRRPGVLAPIASARDAEQLSGVMAAADITLDDAEVRRLASVFDPALGGRA